MGQQNPAVPIRHRQRISDVGEDPAEQTGVGLMEPVALMIAPDGHDMGSGPVKLQKTVGMIMPGKDILQQIEGIVGRKAVPDVVQEDPVMLLRHGIGDTGAGLSRDKLPGAGPVGGSHGVTDSAPAFPGGERTGGNPLDGGHLYGLVAGGNPKGAG